MEKDKSLVNNAMIYGLIFGLILVVFSAITQQSALDGGGGMGKQFIMLGISLLIYFVGVSVSTIHFRKKKLDNIMPYGQAFGFGALVVIFASFIVAVYTFVYTQWINPDYLQELYDVTRQTAMDMYDRMNLPDDAIEQAMDKIEEKGVSTPSAAAFNQIWGGIIMGVIVSLIASIFTQKKNTNPFDGVEEVSAEQE